MTEANPGLSSPKRLAAALVVIVMVVATVAVFAYVASNVVVRSDPGALSLSASLNATTVQQGHAIKVTMGERNNLGFTNRVNFTDNWAVQGLSSGVCGYYLPLAVGVYEGTYSSGNISSAKAMQIDSPGPFFCGAIPLDQSLTLGPSESLTKSRNLTGYWAPSNDSSQGALNPFPPGRYTVVVGDEWGRLRFLYFEVRGVALQGFSLCSSRCGYPSPYLSGIILIDSSSPLASLQLIVNGTAQQAETWGGSNLTEYGIWYKGGFQNPTVAPGDAYALTFTLTFQDGSTASATTVVKAT